MIVARGCLLFVFVVCFKSNVATIFALLRFDSTETSMDISSQYLLVSLYHLIFFVHAPRRYLEFELALLEISWRLRQRILSVEIVDGENDVEEQEEASGPLSRGTPESRTAAMQLLFITLWKQLNAVEKSTKMLSPVVCPIWLVLVFLRPCCVLGIYMFAWIGLSPRTGGIR